MKRTFKGSCHCGNVRFEAEFDLSDGTFKCNCSSCTKNRAWLTVVKPDDFRLVSGKTELTEYESTNTHQFFCRTCGVRPFGHGYDERTGGIFYAVNLGCLDDVDPAELAEAPIQYVDGRHDAWSSTPAEVRHL
jgi:hypothetical protein